MSLYRPFLPKVISAYYVGGHRIRVAFNDNTEGVISFRRWLKGPVFEPLKDLDLFRRFFVDGGTVAWPNGADIAPETLYEAARRLRPGKRLQPPKARGVQRGEKALRTRPRG
jgi:hypothetical protein